MLDYGLLDRKESSASKNALEEGFVSRREPTFGVRHVGGQLSKSLSVAVHELHFHIS